jgi:hypothetical protein
MLLLLLPELTLLLYKYCPLLFKHLLITYLPTVLPNVLQRDAPHNANVPVPPVQRPANKGMAKSFAAYQQIYLTYLYPNDKLTPPYTLLPYRLSLNAAGTQTQLSFFSYIF